MDLEILRQLSQASGVSGFEDKVSEVLMESARKQHEDIETDQMGNLIAKIKGKVDEKVMITAHMDEIGLMVSRIETDGSIKFIPIGEVKDNILMQKTVFIQTDEGQIRGIISCPLEEDFRHRNMFIDIGASNADEVLERGH